MADTATFAVVAELPLGIYRGHAAGDGLDLMPAPARLHAALLCAAAQGTRALPDGQLLRACQEDQAALQWLEANPPDGVALPRHRRVPTALTAFRREGMLRKEGADPGPRDKVLGKPSIGLVAVDGPFAWTWDTPPPAAVVDSLDALTRDVSHLGTSETPARLRIGTAVPTHRRDPDAGLFTGEGLDLDVALAGRGEDLSAAHVAAQGKAPSVANDRYAISEAAQRPPVVRTRLAPARYVAPQPVRVAAPWTLALAAEMSGPPIRELDRVGWAAALHRALVKLIGFGAPSLLTGAYDADVPKPANRLAIQWLDGAAAGAADLDPGRTTALLLFPHDADPVDAAVITSAFTGMRELHRGTDRRKLAHLPARSASAFWEQPVTGGARRWRTLPAAVPDTRPLRGGGWSLSDAALLSVGLVLRHQLQLSQLRGSAGYREIVESVAGRGVKVESAVRIATQGLEHYVHKSPPGVVVQPYRAVLDLGSVVDPRSLVAIGQSRHFGGGLLVPDDGAASIETGR